MFFRRGDATKMVDEIVLRPIGGATKWLGDEKAMRRKGYATKWRCDKLDNDQITGYHFGKRPVKVIMGGGVNYKIPDYRQYKIEGVKELEWTRDMLASKGLKDPWLRLVLMAQCWCCCTPRSRANSPLWVLTNLITDHLLIAGAPWFQTRLGGSLGISLCNIMTMWP